MSIHTHIVLINIEEGLEVYCHGWETLSTGLLIGLPRGISDVVVVPVGLG